VNGMGLGVELDFHGIGRVHASWRGILMVFGPTSIPNSPEN
jgi:hypothetical protein